MLFCGLNKTTLLDYPDRVASTVFLGGCNFRCPFCHNKDLILQPSAMESYSQENILTHLQKRAGILSGVCVTGGEPTLYNELPYFIEKCKNLSLAVKLDTNGSNPAMLKSLVLGGLVDYVAMDIKNCKEKYASTIGLSEDQFHYLKLQDKVEESAAFLLEQGNRTDFQYEFRTTVVKELHTKEDLSEIGKWLAGNSQYFLQSYKESEGVLVPGFSAYSTKELSAFASHLQSFLPNTSLRGIED